MTVAENLSPETGAETEDFATMFEESLRETEAIREGEIVKGKVIQITKDFAIIDIGFKSEGPGARSPSSPPTRAR